MPSLAFAQCPARYLEVYRSAPDVLEITGQVEVPTSCVVSKIEVLNQPMIERRQRVWAFLSLDIQDGPSCDGKRQEIEIDAGVPAYDYERSGVRSSVKVFSDFSWAPELYFGNPPEEIGERTCLRPFIFSHGRQDVDGLNRD